MTENTDKLRAVLLTALMVFSVFAGTIAFAGSAAAANTASVSIGDQVTDGDEITVSSASNGTYNVTLVAWELDSNGARTQHLNQTILNESFAPVSDFTLSNVGLGAGTHDVQVALYNGTQLQNVGSGVSPAATSEATVTVPSFTTNDTLVFAGETVYYNTDDSPSGSANFVLYSGNPGGDSTSPVTALDVNGNGVIAYNTENLDSGDYFITDQGDTAADLTFTVATQDFSASWAEDTVEVGSSLDLEVSSTSNNYDVLLSSGDLSDSELESVFGGNANDDGEIPKSVTATSYAISGDFTGIDAGNYTVDLEVVQTGAEANATVQVVPPGEGSISLSSDLYQGERGDLITITANLANTDEGVINIGSGDANYAAAIAIEDGDGDGTVTFMYNTYMSNTYGNGVDLTTAENDDTATLDTVIPVTAPIAAGQYDMNATLVGSDEEQAVATLSLNERSTTGASTLVAPSNTDLGDGVGALTAAATERSTVAIGDYAVISVEATGLSGFLNTTALGNESAPAGGPSWSEGVEVTFTETNPEPNTPPTTMTASNGGVLANSIESIMTDYANDTVYLVWNTENVEAADWDVTFAVNEELNNVTAEDESVTTQVSTVATSTELNGGDAITVATAEGQEVMGESNLAPGTSLQLRARSTGNNPFLKPASVTVGADGSFTGTFDMSDVPNGTEFTVQVGSDDDTTINGIAIEGYSPGTETTTPEPTSTATPEPTSTATPEPTSTATPEPTSTATPEPTTEEPTEGTTTSGQPGFGLVVSLIAVIAAALLALRRRD